MTQILSADVAFNRIGVHKGITHLQIKSEEKFIFECFELKKREREILRDVTGNYSYPAHTSGEKKTSPHSILMITPIMNLASELCHTAPRRHLLHQPRGSWAPK